MKNSSGFQWSVCPDGLSLILAPLPPVYFVRFLAFYIRFCTCLFFELCLIAGCYCCCCTLPFISCLFFLLLFACGCASCSLLFSTAFVLFVSFALDIQALFGTCCLLSFLGVCSFFCSLTFAITSFDLEGNGLCCNGLCRNGKAVAEERRFAGFLCGMNINGKKE